MSNKHITQVKEMDADKCYGSAEVKKGKGSSTGSAGVGRGLRVEWGRSGEVSLRRWGRSHVDTWGRALQAE